MRRKAPLKKQRVFMKRRTAKLPVSQLLRVLGRVKPQVRACSKLLLPLRRRGELLVFLLVSAFVPGPQGWLWTLEESAIPALSPWLGLRELVFILFFNHDTVNCFFRRAKHGDSVTVPALKEAEAGEAHPVPQSMILPQKSLGLERWLSA